jgi:hypothetical protein
MESKHPSFSFELEYAGQHVNCNVIMQSNEFDILFDGCSMGSIAYNEKQTWILSSGSILPDSIVEEIGNRIESQYE